MRSIPVILPLVELKINCPFFLRDFLATSPTGYEYCFPSHLSIDSPAAAPPSKGEIPKWGQRGSSPCFIIFHPTVHKPTICSSTANIPYVFLMTGASRRPLIITLCEHSLFYRRSTVGFACWEVFKLAVFHFGRLSGRTVFMGVCSALSRAEP